MCYCNTFSENPEITWILKDEKAYGIIQDHISNALLMRTGDLISSKKLFDKLVSLHQTSNIALAFDLFQQLTKLSWDGTSAIKDHIVKIRTIDSHLSRMKLGADTKFMAFALLQSLPCTPEWQIFQSSVINTIEEDKLTFHAVEIWITEKLHNSQE
ncbi:hypothetical protein SERLA73DRAFT_79525 [Serpula lacrymans var. lacrymans S7.3]|uniref:Uncharacterized protein n=2 Tax=Serpula lacrymans var. lacrymans TaxID=341189 RepID=F8QGQ7_SERL3|nr:uncharacterized protein SERLADRAFT_433443 [Serpula lacrymans var. lacrymans S7.9]EGN92490.1 hypothetical protein SERLA73DRAFT_79525 [Serpula lacrymans var. lacrymans S7.3]EGO29464.1 hypothetical protein SERLADRAFT_433443 [Serpula lacrymans var. lacrymans S7.9]